MYFSRIRAPATYPSLFSNFEKGDFGPVEKAYRDVRGPDPALKMNIGNLHHLNAF
jgi:hypothetical protein